MSQAARSAARRKEWRDVNGLACGSPNRGPLAPRSWDDGERSWIPEGARRRGPCARMRGVSAGSGPVHVRLSRRDCRPSAAGAKHGHAEEAAACASGRSAGRTGALTDKPMNRVDAWRMIQRRAADLGTRVRIGCHTFRATGITAYLEAGGTLENAQAMAAHESPRTTKLYDRTGDEITLDEVERITI